MSFNEHIWTCLVDFLVWGSSKVCCEISVEPEEEHKSKISPVFCRKLRRILTHYFPQKVRRQNFVNHFLPVASGK